MRSTILFESDAKKIKESYDKLKANIKKYRADKSVALDLLEPNFVEWLNFEIKANATTAPASTFYQSFFKNGFDKNVEKLYAVIYKKEEKEETKYMVKLQNSPTPISSPVKATPAKPPVGTQDLLEQIPAEIIAHLPNAVISSRDALSKIIGSLKNRKDFVGDDSEVVVQLRRKLQSLQEEYTKLQSRLVQKDEMIAKLERKVTESKEQALPEKFTAAINRMKQLHLRTQTEIEKISKLMVKDLKQESVFDKDQKLFLDNEKFINVSPSTLTEWKTKSLDTEELLKSALNYMVQHGLDFVDHGPAKGMNGSKKVKEWPSKVLESVEKLINIELGGTKEDPVLYSFETKAYALQWRTNKVGALRKRTKKEEKHQKQAEELFKTSATTFTKQQQEQEEEEAKSRNKKNKKQEKKEVEEEEGFVQYPDWQEENEESQQKETVHEEDEVMIEKPSVEQKKCQFCETWKPVDHMIAHFDENDEVKFYHCSGSCTEKFDPLEETTKESQDVDDEFVPLSKEKLNEIKKSAAKHLISPITIDASAQQELNKKIESALKEDEKKKDVEKKGTKKRVIEKNKTEQSSKKRKVQDQNSEEDANKDAADVTSTEKTKRSRKESTNNQTGIIRTRGQKKKDAEEVE